MQRKTSDIIIIGGGLTGLTLAYYLKKAGKDFMLIEQQDRTGGVINTISEQGFTYETGPNTGVLSTPEIVELFEDLEPECKLDIANSQSNKRYIWKKGSWHALPSGLISAVKTPLFSFNDKIRILAEPFRKAGQNPDESIADLVIRRLGKSYLDYAVDPFISGIYAGDPAQLITRFALPKLYLLEQNYGSFIRGSIQKKKLPKSELQKKTNGKVFSVSGGLTNLINALNAAIGDENILTGCNETQVKSLDNNQFLVSFINHAGENTEFQASKVVTTVGGNSLAQLLSFVPVQTLKPLTEMKYAGVVQVAVGYKSWDGIKLDAFGALMPTKEKRNALGILFPSAIFEGRAPANGALLSVFLGGVKNSGLIEKTDHEIKSLVQKELHETMGVTASPDLFKIFRYPFAIPQYDKSTEERLNAISQIQNSYPGLILAGNIRDGIGMSDRVKQGKAISDLLNT